MVSINFQSFFFFFLFFFVLFYFINFICIRSDGWKQLYQKAPFFYSCNVSCNFLYFPYFSYEQYLAFWNLFIDKMLLIHFGFLLSNLFVKFTGYSLLQVYSKWICSQDESGKANVYNSSTGRLASSFCFFSSVQWSHLYWWCWQKQERGWAVGSTYCYSINSG